MSETSSFQDYEECQVFQIFQISMTISISKNDRWDGGPRSTCATPRHSGDDLWSQLSQGIHAIHVIPKVTVPTVLWVQWARVSCLLRKWIWKLSTLQPWTSTRMALFAPYDVSRKTRLRVPGQISTPRHRNSGGSSNRVWDGILIPLFHLVPPVFTYLGRMEGWKGRVDFWEKKGERNGKRSMCESTGWRIFWTCWMMLDDVGCIFSSTDLGFLVRYTVLVSFIFLNLFIAVIFEGFEESRLPSIHSCPTFSAVDIRYISMSCIQYDHHMIIILDHHI